jgi:hypothetical protein
MKYENCPYVENKNKGMARQGSLAMVFNQLQTHNDDVRYDKGSDIVVNGINISVKAFHFTLMSGTLCEDKADLKSIWNIFKENTHSDLFAYMTLDFTCFIMTIDTFEQFVYKFCKVERESSKNKSKLKIRCTQENNEMIRWLNSQAT